MFGFKKKEEFSMDTKAAGQALENIFAACDTTPNKIPFDKILLQARQNLISDNLYIIITIVIFLCTFIAPLFFPHSSIFMSVDSTAGRPLTVAEHVMSEASFSISFDGAPLDAGSSYMLGADNSVVYCEDYDRNSNTIVFPYYSQEYNIYVYDINGRCIHLLLSPHK